MNLGGYCVAQGYGGNSLDGNTASEWHCDDVQGNRYPINMTAVCQWQYPTSGTVAAYAGSQTNAYSWQCYRLSGTTSTPTATLTPTTTPASTAVSTPAPTTPPPGTTSLGGMNLGGYCVAKGYSGNSIDGSTASDWHCDDAQGKRYPINMTAVCQWQYSNAANVTAVASDRNNPYSWQCYS
jgi:hypothetical protein